MDFKGLNLGQSLTKLRKQTFFVKILSCIYEISNLKDRHINIKVAIKPYRQVDLVRKYNGGTFLYPPLIPLMKEDALLRMRGRALACWLLTEVDFKNSSYSLIVSGVFTRTVLLARFFNPSEPQEHYGLVQKLKFKVGNILICSCCPLKCYD